MKRTRRPLEEELNIIRKVVWSFINKYIGLEFDDLFTEAYLAYLEALPYYDSTRGEISTFINHVVSNRLKNMFKAEKYKKMHEHHEDINEIENLLCQETFPNPEQYLISKEQKEEMFAILSPEAFMICKLILEETNIFLATNKPRQCRGIIYHELRKRNWTHARIGGAFRELKQIFSTTA